MSKKNISIEFLILKHIAKKALTVPESARLAAWRKKMKYHKDLPERFSDLNWVARQLDEMDHYPTDRVWEKIRDGIKERPVRRILPRRIFQAAAALLVVIMGIYVVVRYAPRKPAIPSKPAVVAEVAVVRVERGTNAQGTLLTLSDNKKISLDGIGRDSLLSTESHTAIRKADSNRLAYRAGGRLLPDKDTGYNTLSTRKVIPYYLNLADGSKVILNSASTIRYPVAFSGKSRDVELSGVAEFYVRKNPSSPFRVIVNGTVVRVLGTHFIVSAYPDEPEKKITVLEGLVRVIVNNKDSLMLKPMEQAWVDADDSLHKRKIPNTDGLLEWKKDRQFHLDGRSLDELLREVARWYDLKLPDLSNIKGRPIGGGGMLSRDLPDSTVLDNIQALGKIRFDFNGDSLKIRP